MPLADSRLSREHVVVAMPAYNEECVVEFVLDIWSQLAPQVGRLTFVVVDDFSRDPVEEVVCRARVTGRLPSTVDVQVHRNRENLGHGPSVRRAYEIALAVGADAVVHVDGDGQFTGASVLAVLAGLGDATIVQGSRATREDPWYRRGISLGLRLVVGAAAGGVRDPNCPLRAYRRTALETLLPRVPSHSLVPHVHLTMLASRGHLRLDQVDVVSRARLGSGTGTMWRSARSARWVPPRRLLLFCASALGEMVVSVLRPGHDSVAVVPTSPQRASPVTTAKAA